MTSPALERRSAPKAPRKAAIRLSELTGIGIKFGRRYIDQSGLLYHILQQVALQHINVMDVSSTATEFVVYVKDDDAQLAFGSIYQRFFAPKRPQH